MTHYRVGSPIEHRHFDLMQDMEAAWKRRSEPGMEEAYVRICEEMVGIAPKVAASMKRTYPGSAMPRNPGYERLVRFHKVDNPAEAIRLCNLAKKQGWDGKWDGWIAECQKRIEKGV